MSGGMTTPPFPARRFDVERRAVHSSPEVRRPPLPREHHGLDHRRARGGIAQTSSVTGPSGRHTTPRAWKSGPGRDSPVNPVGTGVGRTAAVARVSADTRAQRCFPRLGADGKGRGPETLGSPALGRVWTILGLNQ